MKKPNRENVFGMFEGLCAFCGNGLEKGWHVWDIKPIRLAVNTAGQLETINTEECNLLPACKSCGSVRIKERGDKLDIEDFRKEIVHMYEFCRDGAMYSSSVRRAIQFGIIRETNIPVKFYFEKLNDLLP